MIHATGPYRCDHIRIRGRAMMTHTPPNGAFRGFGAPQTQFAVEAHMDVVAESVLCVYEERDKVHGLKMVYEPKYLRFFQARFEPM